jgi:hypothetical protein
MDHAIMQGRGGRFCDASFRSLIVKQRGRTSKIFLNEYENPRVLLDLDLGFC